MSQPPVIFVVGPVGHGKTTVREIFVRLLKPLRGASCSDVIYHFLSVRKGVSVEALKALPKEQLRPELIEAGDFLCGSIGELKEAPSNKEIDGVVYRHPSALIRTLYMNGYNVIDGVRRRLELQDATKHLEWNGVEQLTVHVFNPRAPAITDNSEDLRDLADEQLVNDGTEAELEAKIDAILCRKFPQVPMKPNPVLPAEVAVAAPDTAQKALQ